MKPPAPYYGSKLRAAPLIWDALGQDVPNYVEPFCGMAACLLARPRFADRVETINDLHGLVTNVWRAIRDAPEEVTYWCDQPVSELDLHAVHRQLVEQADETFTERLREDPDFCDPKIAGRWLWGKSAWVGSGWCRDPHVRKRPTLDGQGNRAKQGLGVHSGNLRQPLGLPLLRGGGSDQSRRGLGHGCGVHSSTVRDHLGEYFDALSTRLRYVRVCCGDWKRVVTPAVTTSHGLTGVLLDPPYAESTGRKKNIYAEDGVDLSAEVREWALEHGHDPFLRIVLCGLEGEHDMPEDWTMVAWKPRTSFATALRERLWLSPNCLRPQAQLGLLENVGG